MIVYGKRRLLRSASEMITEVGTCLGSLTGDHESTAEAREMLLIATGQLTQGVLDLEHESCGEDQDSPLSRVCGLLMRLAGEVFVHGPKRQTVVDFGTALSCTRSLL